MVSIIQRITLLFLITLALPLSAHGATPPVPEPNLQIFYSNDVHGEIEPCG